MTPDLEAAVAYEVTDKVIPSISYAVFDRRRMLAQGHEVAAGTPPLSDDALFRVGSISKTFCALAAMRLVAQGHLDLDTDIGPVLGSLQPEDPFHDSPVPLTLRKLLSHRAGLTREAAIGNYLDASEAPLAATLRSLRGTRYKVDPSGQVYRYSNAGFAIVGALIEATGGESYEAHLKRHILAPLGLADTHMRLAEAQRRRLAPARVWTKERDAPAPIFDMGSAPAGNIAASLEDMARYGQALLNGGEPVLRPAALAAAWTLPPETTTGYGLGFAVGQLDGQRCVGHGGALYGYSSQLLLLPDAGLGVVMLSTLDVTHDVIDRLARYALRLALAGVGGERPMPPRRLPRPAPAVCDKWIGTYVAEDCDRLSLEVAAERLYLVHRAVPLELRPDGPRRFVLDGRLHGEGTSYAFPVVDLSGPNEIVWRGKTWHRGAPAPKPPGAPAEIAPHLGRYGPADMATHLIWTNRLVCVMEGLFAHDCIALGDGRHRLGPGMYEDEIVTFGGRDAAGRPVLRVGDMTLAREA